MNQYPPYFVCKTFSDFNSKNINVVNKSPCGVNSQNNLLSLDKKVFSYDSVKQGLFGVLVQVPGDGHCLLHAISGAMNTCLEKVKARITMHIAMNAKFYNSFCPDFMILVENYMKKKQWNTILGDMLPCIVASTFNVQFNVLKKIGNDVLLLTINPSDEIVSLLSQENKDLRTYTLFLENNHYSYFSDIDKGSSQSEFFEKSSDFCVHGDSYSKKRNNYIPTLVLPYSSEYTLKCLTKAKKKLKYGDSFQLTYRSKAKLSSVLKNLYYKDTDHRQKWDEKIGIVYQASCNLCAKHDLHSTYIGETSRKLSDRISEHLRQVDFSKLNLPSTSAIAHHSYTQHGKCPTKEDWDFTPLKSNIYSTQNRKVIEAVMIAKRRPELNKDSGVYYILSNFDLNL